MTSWKNIQNDYIKNKLPLWQKKQKETNVKDPNIVPVEQIQFADKYSQKKLYTFKHSLKNLSCGQVGDYNRAESITNFCLDGLHCVVRVFFITIKYTMIMCLQYSQYIRDNKKKLTEILNVLSLL